MRRVRVRSRRSRSDAIPRVNSRPRRFRRTTSTARFRAVVTIQPAGSPGTPSRSHRSTAVTKASCTASSASAMSPNTRTRVATACPCASRNARSTSSIHHLRQWPACRRPVARNGRTSMSWLMASTTFSAEANAASSRPGASPPRARSPVPRTPASAGISRSALVTKGEATIRTTEDVLFVHGRV